MDLSNKFIYFFSTILKALHIVKLFTFVMKKILEVQYVYQLWSVEVQYILKVLCRYLSMLFYSMQLACETRSEKNSNS